VSTGYALVEAIEPRLKIAYPKPFQLEISKARGLQRKKQVRIIPSIKYTNDLTCLIHSGDKNSFIWPYWNDGFKQNWKSDIPVVWLGQTKTPDFIDKKNSFITGNVPWSNGLLSWLQNKCTSRFILYSMEDFILIRQVNTEMLKFICDIMKKNKIGLVKLYTNRQTMIDKINNRKEFGLLKVRNCMRWLCSCLPSIWSRDLLIDVLKNGETPWLFEQNGTGRLARMMLQHYAYLDSEVFPFREVIQQGKVKLSSYRFLRSINVKPEEKLECLK